MELEKAIKQLKSLQEDRKSFIEDETELNSIFMEDYEAVETVLKALEDYKKENEELKNMDLTTVYLKGVADEKERWRKKIKRKIDELRIQVTSKEFTHDMYMGTEKFIMFTKLCAMGEVLKDLLKEE